MPLHMASLVPLYSKIKTDNIIENMGHTWSLFNLSHWDKLILFYKLGCHILAVMQNQKHQKWIMIKELKGSVLCSSKSKGLIQFLS